MRIKSQKNLNHTSFAFSTFHVYIEDKVCADVQKVVAKFQCDNSSAYFKTAESSKFLECPLQQFRTLLLQYLDKHEIELVATVHFDALKDLQKTLDDG